MSGRENYRIVFFGTPEFAVSSLDSLIEAGYDVAAVVTSVDKASGRGKKVSISDVKKYALDHDLEILQPPNLKSEKFVQKLKSYNADAFVVVAFRMLPEVVWSMPPDGTINIHGSLLPKYRGAAPIHWAVIAGEAETGVTAFRLQHAIDTGGILMQASVPIAETDTTGVVYNKLRVLGADLLVSAMDAICQGTATERQQDESEVSHAPKIFKEDAYIDFDQDYITVYNFIRGMSPFPGAWTHMGDKIFKIYFASYEPMEHDEAPGTLQVTNEYMHVYTLHGIIKPIDVQLQGRKRMTIEQFLLGTREFPERLGS